MRLLFLAKRWHLWRHRFAKWALMKVVNPLGLRLGRMAQVSGVQANTLNSMAAQRLAVCQRCPLYSALNTCNACNCFMPAKVQIDTATCPQKRW